jgi:hypothetical protein
MLSRSRAGTGIYITLNAISLFRFSYLTSLDTLKQIVRQLLPIGTPWDLQLSVVELIAFFLYLFALLHWPTLIVKAVEKVNTKSVRTIAEAVGWAIIVIAVVWILLYCS